MGHGCFLVWWTAEGNQGRADVNQALAEAVGEERMWLFGLQRGDGILPAGEYTVHDMHVLRPDTAVPRSLFHALHLTKHILHADPVHKALAVDCVLHIAEEYSLDRFRVVYE